MSDTTPDTAAPKATFGKQQIIATILTLAILVIVFAVVIPQFGNYDDAWSAIGKMNLGQLGFIALATVAVIVIYVYPYLAALPGIRYWPAFVVRQTSFMISNVIPGGGAWGLAVQYAMLSSYGFGAAPTTAAIGITSVWNSFVTLSLPVFALLGLVIVGEGTVEAGWASALALGIVVVGIVVFAVILRSEDQARSVGRWLGSVANRAIHLVKKDMTLDVEGMVVDFRASIVDVVRDRWIVITVANVGQQLAQFSVLYFAIVALQGGFDGPITLFHALAAFAFGRLATFIPIPPGGLGTTDAIITGMLTGFGLPSSDALGATMVWRAATYFPQVVIGIITFLVWRRHEAKRASAV